MKKFHIILLTLLLLLMNARTNKSINPDVINNFKNILKEHKQYCDVIDQFISYARDKDVKSMISITSPFTISRYGEAYMNNLYSSDIIPGISRCIKFKKNNEIKQVFKK